MARRPALSSGRPGWMSRTRLPVVAIGVLGALAATVLPAFWFGSPDTELAHPPLGSDAQRSSAARPPAAYTAGLSQPTGTLNVAAFPPPTPDVAGTDTAQSATPEPRTRSDWPDTVLQNPDPRVRRQALEEWARNPQRSLDLVSAMMVDTDETIRGRAQQIFEDAMARH